VDEMVNVSTDEICAAIKDAFVDTRVVLEPAGALAVAGVRKFAATHGVTGKTFVAVASGANIDFDRLRFVSELADTSETLISVQIPERPGAFLELYNHIYPRNVTAFHYRISGDEASIFLSFQASSRDDRDEVLEALRGAGLKPMDLEDNELAQTHCRHMATSRAPFDLTQDEALFRFEFPERPGALLRFLENLPQDFNVSLFHYRSHGADVARVLVGIQAPGKKRAQLREYLDFLTSKGYTWCEETENPLYDNFLLEPACPNRSGRSRPRKPPPLTLSGGSR